MVSLACLEAERAARRQILVIKYKIVSYHVLYSQHEIAPRNAKSKSTLFNFVNTVATYTELRYFKAERSARRLGLAIGIVSSIISRDAMGCKEK
jgi:hypothetical protein